MLQPLGCIIKQLCTKNEMRTKHSRSPMHTRFPLLLDNIVSMSALVSVCVTSTFYSSTIKSPLLSYCMLQYSPFTHGICTFIDCLNWMLCFYCLLFRVSFSILEHATAPKLGRGDHLGWHCFFFVSKVFCLLVQSMTSSYVGKLCLMVGLRLLRSLLAILSECCFTSTWPCTVLCVQAYWENTIFEPWATGGWHMALQMCTALNVK